MEKSFDRRLHSQLVEKLFVPSSVSHCLAYENMLDVTPEFDQFARQHFAAIHGLAWRDLCPAYALALMTHGTYELPEDEAHLEALWEELTTSDVDWRQARSVVVDSWHWLDSPRRLS